MAAPVYDSDLTATNGGLVSDANVITNWDESSDGAWDDGGGPVAETDFYIQGTECVSAQFTKTGVGTIIYNYGAAFTLPTDGAFLIWCFWASPPSLATYANGGVRTLVGTSLGDFKVWKASGSDFEPNPYGGWYNYAVDPLQSADTTVGTPGATYQYIGMAINATAQARGQPFAVDAIRGGRCEARMSEGDLVNGYATIVGFSGSDGAPNERWALIQEISGGYKWQGLMILGYVNPIDFRDSNRNIVVANTPMTTTNFNKIEVRQATSRVDWTNFNITATGTQSRGDFEIVDNAVVNKDTCVFTDMGTWIYLSNSTILNTTYRRCDRIFQNGATFTNCIFDSSITSAGSPASDLSSLLATNLSTISNCQFISGVTGSPLDSGHAIEINATGTYTFTGNTYLGYGADDTIDAVIFNTSGGLVTINIVGGDTPTIRNGAGSTTVVNNAVTIKLQGATEGAAVKIVANETVGTITLGDAILETLTDSNGEASTSLNYEGAFEPTGLDVIARVRSSGLPAATIQDDNSVFINETTNANKANSASMNLLPTTPVVNEDRYLFGHPEMFNNMKIDINTTGTGGFTITWQYWNGVWTNLTGVVDDTNSFSVLGENHISFTMPGDWATTTINGQGQYYYIRAAYTAGTVTVVPLGTRCALDVTRYLPFVQDGTVLSSGLTVTASWNEDTIATF